MEEDRAADELGDEDGADDSDEYVPEKRRREDGEEEGAAGSQETQPESGEPLRPSPVVRGGTLMLCGGVRFASPLRTHPRLGAPLSFHAQREL